MDANAKLAELNASLEAGKTVYVSTYTRAWKITKKTAEKFADAGTPIFKVGTDGSLYMARGRSYDCIDFCRISTK